MFNYRKMPIVFINCSSVPYVDKIMNHEKVFETRTKNTLRSLIGERVLICETGKDRSMVRCSALIESVYPVRSIHEWELLRDYTCVPVNGVHDWKSETQVKWLYHICDVVPVSVPFHPKEGKRHGRVWMEYNGME